MIVSLFIALFLLVGIGAFVRESIEHRSLTPRRGFSYGSSFARSIPEADNL